MKNRTIKRSIVATLLVVLLLATKYSPAQSDSTHKKDTCISWSQYKRSNELKEAICNILQYIRQDGKVTDRRMMQDAIKHYMKLLNQ